MFDEYSKQFHYKEDGSNMPFIWSKYGKITMLENNDTHADLHVVGPFLNSIRPQVLGKLYRKLKPLTERLVMLDGEISGDIPISNIHKVADIIKIKRKAKPRGCLFTTSES